MCRQIVNVALILLFFTRSLSAEIITLDFGYGSSGNTGFGFTSDASVPQNTTFSATFTDGLLSGTATFSVFSFDNDNNDDGTIGDNRTGVTTELRSNTLGVSGNTSASIDPRGETLGFTLLSLTNLTSLELQAINLANVQGPADPAATLGALDVETTTGVTLDTNDQVFGTPLAWTIGTSLLFYNALNDAPAGADDYAVEAITLSGTVAAVPEPTTFPIIILIGFLSWMGSGRRFIPSLTSIR